MSQRTKKKTRQKIVIIGCGNLAWHLAKHFSELGMSELYVYNHRQNKQLSAFEELHCHTASSLDKIINDASFYFICVSDKHIAEVSEKIHPVKATALVLHTSGSTPIGALRNLNAGVFYPVQTFTREVNTNWKEIPVLIEVLHKNDLETLRTVAQQFSGNVLVANSEERLKIHLAAVLVNNFTNALYAATDDFLSKELKNNQLNFNVLLPLIRGTTLKLENLRPLKAQTGPARRGDSKIMKEHLELLKSNKRLKKLYKQFSQLIEEQQNVTHA